MDEKEERRENGKELREDEMRAALHFISSGVSNRLPVTDYAAPPPNNEHPTKKTNSFVHRLQAKTNRTVHTEV